jgi:hypothetical protein
MTKTDTLTWRELQARNAEAAGQYWDEAFATADDEARANLAHAYNADN